MTCNDINIRDPYVLVEAGKYYMYGTRGKNYGIETGGFDVYVSDDLVTWSDPIECFDSVKYGMNGRVNWAPEVHKYKGTYYMFATFKIESTGQFGTYILRADSPLGPFVPHSDGVITPKDWQSLDGTLYVSKTGKPYMVFCHGHSPANNGMICYVELSDDLTRPTSEPVVIFDASTCPYATVLTSCGRFITDGPFLYRTDSGALMMIWASFINDQYAEMLVRFDDGELNLNFTHLPPLTDNDSGHGMIFKADHKLYLTVHTPNTMECEHPVFIELTDCGDTLLIKK